MFYSPPAMSYQAPPFRHGMGDLSQALSALGRSSVKRVVFRSQISPDVVLDPAQQTPRAASQGGVSELFLRAAKPALYADTPVGSFSVAPWGEPRTNYFPLLVGGLAIFAALGAGFMVRGLRKR